MSPRGWAVGRVHPAILALTLALMPLLGTMVAPGVSAAEAGVGSQDSVHLKPGASLAVTIRKAPPDCRAVVELLQNDVIITERSQLVGVDGRAKLTIRAPGTSGRYLLQARLGGPRCPQEGLQQPAQQRTVVVG